MEVSLLLAVNVAITVLVLPVFSAEQISIDSFILLGIFLYRLLFATMALVQMALTVVVVNFVLFGLSTIVVALRCYVRITRKSFGLDDWLLVSGYVCWIFSFVPTTNLDQLLTCNKGVFWRKCCNVHSLCCQRLGRPPLWCHICRDGGGNQGLLPVCDT